LAALSSSPLYATDAQVAPYADNYFEYDVARRVSLERMQAAGSSSSPAPGLGTFTFSYTTSSNADGYNSWKYKTVETLTDNTPTNISQNIVYSNSYGEVMLNVYENGTPDTVQQWETFYQYDNQGRIVLTANPSALSGYDESQPNL